MATALLHQMLVRMERGGYLLSDYDFTLRLRKYAEITGRTEQKIWQLAAETDAWTIHEYLDEAEQALTPAQKLELGPRIERDDDA